MRLTLRQGPGSARPSKGPRSQRRRPSVRRVAAMQRWQSCLRKRLLGTDTSLRVGKDAIGEGDPGASPRSPKSGVEGLSAQRGSCPPGNRAARALRRRILAGACAHRVRRAALRLPSGSRSGLQLGPRRSPGRPLRWRREPGGRSPSRRPQLQPVFVASSRSTARRRLAVSGFARGWEGVVSFGVARTCSGRGASLGMYRPPAGCKERRRECTGPSSSCSEPREWGEGKPESSASRSGGSRRRRLGCRPGDLRVEK